MGVRLNPYISFKDEAREAMAFYQEVFGGDLTMSTFAEFGASEDPSEADNIMHAQLESPDGLMLMAADTPSWMEYAPPAGVSVSLSGDDGERLTQLFEGLTDGGTVAQPLTPSPWGDTFGMGVDRFGITWVVNISSS